LFKTTIEITQQVLSCFENIRTKFVFFSVYPEIRK
jgi:hypothetical protein